MTDFVFHELDSAPEGSKAALEGAQKALGFVPNLYAGLAEAPAALKAYLTLGEVLGGSSFSPVEQQVLFLAVSAENGCDYCMAAHSTIARNMVKVDGAVVDALRDRARLPDARLDALAQFTHAVVSKRGWVRGPVLDRFLAAGYTRAQVLEVILAVAMKTLSNYSNHVMQTPVDDAFQGEAWSR